MTLIITLAFIVGLTVGSFLNVVIRRGSKKQSIRGRSHCESCRETLGFWDLIPVLSYFLRKGRCRYCGAAFSRQYPLVESSTAILFSAAAYLFTPTLNSPASWLVLLGIWVGISASAAIFVSDFLYTIIPNGSVIILFILGIILLLKKNLGGNPGWYYDLAGAAIFALFFLALWFFSKGRWMGFGDVKLTPALALIVGFPASLSGFLFSFWLGGIFGIILLVIGRKKLKNQMPFGPFLILGFALAYFYSPTFIYLSGLYSILPA